MRGSPVRVGGLVRGGRVPPAAVAAELFLACGFAGQLAPVRSMTFGGDDVGVQFVSLPQLLLRTGTNVLGFALPVAGFLPQALGLDFCLLRVGLSPGSLRLALPGTDFLGPGLFTHFDGLVAVRFHFAPAAEHDCHDDDREDDNDADNDPYELS